MEVRKAHQIDEGRLQEYMQDHVAGFSGAISVSQFKGGQSNPTYKIEAGGQAYVLRRKPPGKLLPSAHAVDREYRVITALGQTDVPVPKSYGLCEDPEVIGTAFYIMSFADGRIFWNPELPEQTPSERGEIFDFLTANKIGGVVLMSADRHRSDLWKIERDNDYAIYEFNSSRLTNQHVHGTMATAEFSYNKKQSFGTVDVDTTAADPTVTYRIVTIDGEEVFEFELPLSRLTPR